MYDKHPYYKDKERKKPFDKQVNGEHYKGMAIQPIEFIMANDLGFCEGNVIKYICRYKQKGGVVDLDKVIHYVEMLKEGIKEDSKKLEKKIPKEAGDTEFNFIIGDKLDTITPITTWSGKQNEE